MLCSWSLGFKTKTHKCQLISAGGLRLRCRGISAEVLQQLLELRKLLLMSCNAQPPEHRITWPGEKGCGLDENCLFKMSTRLLSVAVQASEQLPARGHQQTTNCFPARVGLQKHAHPAYPTSFPSPTPAVIRRGAGGAGCTGGSGGPNVWRETKIEDRSTARRRGAFAQLKLWGRSRLLVNNLQLQGGAAVACLQPPFHQLWGVSLFTRGLVGGWLRL